MNPWAVGAISAGISLLGVLADKWSISFRLGLLVGRLEQIEKKTVALEDLGRWQGTVDTNLKGIERQFDRLWKFFKTVPTWSDTNVD